MKQTSLIINNHSSCYQKLVLLDQCEKYCTVKREYLAQTYFSAISNENILAQTYFT
jgi:hypothetical protein